MEIGKFKLAKANLIRPPKKPKSEFLTREEAEIKSPGLFNAEVNENVVTKNYDAEDYVNRIKSYMRSKYIDEDFGRQLIEKKLKEMEMVPSDLDTSRINRAIGGGVITGEDLGTREGYGRPKVDIPGLDQKVEELFKENLSNNQVLQKINEIPEYKDVNIGTVKRIKKEKGLGGQREQLFSSQAEKYNRLKALIEESNKNLDFVEMQSLRETVGLPKKVAQTDYENYKKFNIPKLDTAPDKVTKAFNKIINNPNIPVEQVFDLSSTIARQTGLSVGQASETLNTLPEYQDFKPVALKLQNPAFKSGVVNKGKTLADVIEMAENVGTSSGYTSVANSPERFILNSVIRHINQGGDKIEWVVPPSDTVNDVDAVFRYKGKDYNYYDLLQNGRKIDDFKEIYKSYDEMKDLLSREVTDPVTKGKTTFKDLMTRAYAQGAGYAETTNPFEIDHFGSVKNEPFSNLRIIPTRINRAAGAITDAAQRATTGFFTKKGKDWTPAKSKLYLQKSGYNFTKDINKLFNDEIKLANDILVKGRKLRKVSDIGKEAVEKKFTELLNIEGVQRASEIDRPESALQGEMFKNFNERLSKLTNTPTAEVAKDVSNVTKVINEMSNKMGSGMDPVLLAKYVKAQAQDLAEFGAKYGGNNLGFVGKTLAGLDLPIMQVFFGSMQDWEQDSPLWVTLPAAFTDEVANAFNLYQKTGGKAKEFGKFLASSFVPKTFFGKAVRSPLFKAVSKVGKVGSVATPLLEAGQEAYKFEKMKGMLPEIAQQFNIPIEEARKGFENYIRSTIPQDLAGQGFDETTVPESPGLPGLLRTFQDIGSFFGLSESPYKDPNANEDIITPMSKPSLDERGFLAVGGRVGFFKGAVAGGGNISPGTRADYTPGQGTRDDNPFTGGGGGPKEPPKTSAYQKIKALGTVPLNLIGGIFGNPFDPTKPHQVINTKAQMDYLNYLANQKNEDTGTLSYGDYGTQFNLSDLKDPIAFSTAMTMGGTGYKKSDTGDITYTGGTYDFDGAVPFVDQGGLMGWAYRGGEYLANKFNPARLANGGRIGFADGPKNPKKGLGSLSKRNFLKTLALIPAGIMAIRGGPNLLKKAKQVVPAAKKAATEAEKIFFNLVDAVKNKGILKKLDEMTDYRQGGAYHEYKGAEVLEDGGSITARFKTDTGAPAEIVYIKPQKRIDPETGKVVEYPGEFDYEAQEIGRMNPEGDVDIDAEFEIIDSLEDVKKLIDD